MTVKSDGGGWRGFKQRLKAPIIERRLTAAGLQLENVKFKGFVIKILHFFLSNTMTFNLYKKAAQNQARIYFSENTHIFCFALFCFLT